MDRGEETGGAAREDEGDDAGDARPPESGAGGDTALATPCEVAVGEGEPAGPAARAATGSSVAPVASQRTRRYGPDPTGLALNGSSASEAGGTFSSRWTGRRGCVAACRKPPIGVAKSKRTVRSSIAVAVTSRHEPA